MAHLMAEDEEDLVGGALGDGGIPDHDALRRSEAGDVGVEVGDFGGGLHEEHAVGWNVNAFTAGDDLFKPQDDSCGFDCESGSKWLKRGSMT